MRQVIWAGLLNLWVLGTSNCSAFAANIVAVVSAKSQIGHLTPAQIADIFLGKNNRLPSGEVVVPVDQEEGSRSRDQFYFQITGKSPDQIKAYWTRLIFTGKALPPKVITDGAQLKKFIATNPNAIGYIDSALVDDSVKIIP